MMCRTLNPAVARVLRRLHYSLDVILSCVWWYVAYPLSLRHLEEMMAERGVSVNHSTVHRWAIKPLAVLASRANGDIFTAVDKDGNTIDLGEITCPE